MTATFYNAAKKPSNSKFVGIIIVFLIGTVVLTYLKNNESSKTETFITILNKTRAIEQVSPRNEPEIAPINVDDKWLQLNNELSKTGDKYSLYIENLSDGKTYSYRPSTNMYAASLYKVPVALAVISEIQKGRFNYDTEFSYVPEYYSDGMGVVDKSVAGQKYTVKLLLQYLLDNSDNAAQNMLTDVVGIGNVSNAITNNLTKKSQSSFATSNTSSVAEIGEFLKNVYLSKNYTVSNKNYLISEMSETAYDDRIYAGLYENLKFAHKIGNWSQNGSWHDCGYLYKGKVDSTSNQVIIVCLMSQNTSLNEFIRISKLVGNFVSSIPL